MGDHASHTTRDWLLQELERVRAHKAELEGHRHEEARLVRELAEVDRALAEHGHVPKRLPLLDRIRVASPCKVDWDSMTGDARTRHCRSCDKDVHDISAMSREAAEAFLQRVAGTETCVRFYQRADGTVLSQGDCPVGARKRRRKVLLVGAGAGLIGASAGLAGVWALEPPPPVECQLPATMGSWAPAPESVAHQPGPDEPVTVMGALRADPSDEPAPSAVPGEFVRYTDADGNIKYRLVPLPQSPRKPKAKR